MFGGGQERGLRPGTLPVPLIAGFGRAAELAHEQFEVRAKKSLITQKLALKALQEISGIKNGHGSETFPYILNVSIPTLDSEAIMVTLKRIAAISNGSACTSIQYAPSHVLKAMNLPTNTIAGAIRFSWGYNSVRENTWKQIVQQLAQISQL